MSDVPDEVLEARALHYAENALNGVCALLPHLSGVVALVFVQAETRIDTACVFASGRMLINPGWFLSLAASDAIFVLAHEVMHLALQTHQRMAGSEMELFNLAHDLIINDLLCKELGCSVPEGGLLLDGASQFSAERIVSDLRQKIMQGECLPQPGWGACKGACRTGSTRGDAFSAIADALHRAGVGPQTASLSKTGGDALNLGGDVLSEERERLWFPDDDPRDVSDWRAEIHEEARIAIDLGILQERMEQLFDKQRGDDPGDAYALMIALQEQHAPPWQQAVQRWIESVMSGPRTFTRSSRRGADRTDLVLPGRKREGWTLHLVLDTSGSMVGSLPMILGAISAFCVEMNIDQVHVLQCDAEVTCDAYFAPEDLANFTVAGFGGSDMIPAMMRLAQDPEVEVVIVLTDGWISYPSTPMPYEVLWVLDQENGFAPPYGQVMALTR